MRTLVILVLAAGLLAPTTSAEAALVDTLTISAPAIADVGTGSAGGAAFSGSLGTVSVSDTRGALAGGWIASVTSTDFTTGTATPAETIGKASVSYWSGALTSSTGLTTFLPGQLTALLAVTLASSRTAFSVLVHAGNNSAAWNPTLIVNPPAAAVSGTYTGTITHSVA